MSRMRAELARERRIEIEYGLKEFVQGLLVGLVVGLIIATQFLA